MNEELCRRLLSWCVEDAALGAEPAGAEREGRQSVRVRTATGVCELEIATDEPDRVTLESRVSLTAEHGARLADAGLETAESLSQALSALVMSRSSLVCCAVVGSGRATALNISHAVYADGLSRHSFLSAFSEVVRFRQVLERWLADLPPMARLQRDLDQTFAQIDRLLKEAEPTLPCPVCESPVPPRTEVCAACGARVSEARRLVATAASPARVCASPGCGRELPGRAQFCPACGRGVSRSAPAARPDPAPARCGNAQCGQPLPPDVTFCPACGGRATGSGALSVVTPAARRCPNPLCGRPVPTGKAYCAVCGTAVG